MCEWFIITKILRLVKSINSANCGRRTCCNIILWRQHRPQRHIYERCFFLAIDRLRLLFLASENIIEMWKPESSLSEMFNGKLKFCLRSNLILESGQRRRLSWNPQKSRWWMEYLGLCCSFYSQTSSHQHSRPRRRLPVIAHISWDFRARRLPGRYSSFWLNKEDLTLSTSKHTYVTSLLSDAPEDWGPAVAGVLLLSVKSFYRSNNKRESFTHPNVWR